MTTEIDEHDTFVASLKEKYPEMYDNVYCGISISEGWYEIIYHLSSSIYSHCKFKKIDYPKVAQIKEKFGGLRFYVDGGDDFTHGAIQMAENWASRTCETCGERGQRRSGGWLRTLCDKHEAERQEQIAKRKAGV